MLRDPRLAAILRALLWAMAMGVVGSCGPSRVFPIRALDASLFDPPTGDAYVDVAADLAVDGTVPDAVKPETGLMDAGRDVPIVATCPPVVNSPIGYATAGPTPTTGGEGGTLVTVTTSAALAAAAAQTDKLIIRVSGKIALTDMVRVKSDKTIQGALGAGDGLIGGGLYLGDSQNIVIRYLSISKVLSPADAVGLNKTKNVWIDHCDLSSSLTDPQGTYDGLVDITHGSDWVTLSWNVFHDHYLTSLVGSSPDTGSEDADHLTVTYHHNVFRSTVFYNPKVRFGSVHVFNNVYEYDGVHKGTAIVSQQNAQVWIEANVFKSVLLPISTAVTMTDMVAGTVSIPDPDTNVYVECGVSPDPVAVKPWASPPYVYRADTAAYAEGVSWCAGPDH